MLVDEWDTSTISDLSNEEIEKMFLTPLAMLVFTIKYTW